MKYAIGNISTTPRRVQVMTVRASRRSFLAFAGASAGLLATGAGRAEALERQGPPPGATETTSPATIVGITGSVLEVRPDGFNEHIRLETEDFGTWKHELGDRVIIVREPSGRKVARPFVTTIDAPLPRRPEKVQVDSVIEVGKISARVGSEGVKAAYEAMKAASYRGPAHWLLIENSRTGELRVFGVIGRG
jgi:hypothetical protein